MGVLIRSTVPESPRPPAPSLTCAQFGAYRDRAKPELFANLDPDELRLLDAAVPRPIRLKRGEALYQPGAPFVALFAIGQGSCKTTILAEDGREQVVGFHLPSEIVGLDGVGTRRHGCEAIALEDSTLWALPFDRLERLARGSTALQHNLYQFLSRDIGHDHYMMLVLGSMRADERLAAFLLGLSDRYQQLGYSPTAFVLRMSRAEIGSYLGIKLETVSRVLSRLQENGVLQIQGRNVRLFALSTLKRLACRRDSV